MILYLLAAVALVAVGVVIGVITVVSLGIHREERDFTLMNNTQDRLARGARRLTRLYTRGPDAGRQARRHHDDDLV